MRFILPVLYLLITVPLYIDYLSGCPSTPTTVIAGLCDIAVFAFGIPWTYLSVLVDNNLFDTLKIVGFIAIFLNTILLYYIGKMISKLGAAIIRKITK